MNVLFQSKHTIFENEKLLQQPHLHCQKQLLLLLEQLFYVPFFFSLLDCHSYGEVLGGREEVELDQDVLLDKHVVIPKVTIVAAHFLLVSNCFTTSPDQMNKSINKFEKFLLKNNLTL